MTDAEKSVDQKRKETEEQVESGVKTVYTSSMGFLTSTARAVFWTTVYFALGAIVLYCSKIAKANILPVENTCIPKIPDNEINVFIDTTNNTSQKFKFTNSSENTKNYFLDEYRNYSNLKKGKGHFTLFKNTILESLILKNNQDLNFILKFLNKFSESFIVLVGPIILSVLLSFLGVIDCFYFMYLWFTGLSIFFKKEDPVSGDMISLGSNDKTSSYFWGICKAFFLVCLFTIPALTVAPGIVSIVSLSCLIGMMGYKGKLQTKTGLDKELSVGSFIIETFKFFKVNMMIIFSIIITSNAFTDLGALAGLFAIVTILLIKFDFISIGLFKPIVPDFVSPRTDDCNPGVTAQPVDTPACDNLSGNACSGQSGGGKQSGPRRKVSKGYMEQFLDDVTGKTHKDLMRQIHRLSTF